MQLRVAILRKIEFGISLSKVQLAFLGVMQIVIFMCNAVWQFIYNTTWQFSNRTHWQCFV